MQRSPAANKSAEGAVDQYRFDVGWPLDSAAAQHPVSHSLVCSFIHSFPARQQKRHTRRRGGVKVRAETGVLGMRDGYRHKGEPPSERPGPVQQVR